MTDERDETKAAPSEPAGAAKGYRDEASALDRLADDGTTQAQLYFERVGPVGAPTVYYLHGGPGYNASSFRELMGEELEAYDVIYADARGGGRSPGVLGSDVDVLAEDVAAVLGELEVEEAVLLAHGFGAMVAAQVAADHPELVRRLVLVNPWISMPRLAQDLNLAAQRVDAEVLGPEPEVADETTVEPTPEPTAEPTAEPEVADETTAATTDDEGTTAEVSEADDAAGPVDDPASLVDEAFAIVNPKVLFDSLQFRSPAARLRLEHVDAVALSGDLPRDRGHVLRVGAVRWPVDEVASAPHARDHGSSRPQAGLCAVELVGVGFDQGHAAETPPAARLG